MTKFSLWVVKYRKHSKASWPKYYCGTPHKKARFLILKAYSAVSVLRSSSENHHSDQSKNCGFPEKTSIQFCLTKSRKNFDSSCDIVHIDYLHCAVPIARRDRQRAGNATAGCLLKPRCGDTVLTAFLPDGEAWVTCVLARAEADGEAELALPDRTALRARELSVESEKTSFVSRTISTESTILSLGGGLLLQGFAAVQTAARRVGERIARKEGRYGELSERTEGLDERSAGRMRVKSETSYRLRAENADVRAEAMLDLDAERIKVG